jgi:hypothetical protein
LEEPAWLDVDCTVSFELFTCVQMIYSKELIEQTSVSGRGEE